MRRIVAGFAAAAILAVVPTLVVASNQEIADQIVRRLRDGGRMSDYSVGVTYKDGTARLRGRVASEEQMATALKVAFQTPGVASVINELVVTPSETNRAGSGPQEASSSHIPFETGTLRWLPTMLNNHRSQAGQDAWNRGRAAATRNRAPMAGPVRRPRSGQYLPRSCGTRSPRADDYAAACQADGRPRGDVATHRGEGRRHLVPRCRCTPGQWRWRPGSFAV